MTMTFDAPPAGSRAGSPAEHLRASMAAARVGFTWFGTRKTLTSEQKAEAAEAFGAEGPFLSAGKKLIDTRHAQFKKVTRVRSQTLGYWRSISLPFPEPGVRLIRQDQLDAFHEQMGRFQTELAQAVEALDEEFDELKRAARTRLGRLYNSSDYPDSLIGLFEMSWDFPSVEPPDYLRQLRPELYQAECERVQARFDEAVRLAEEAFVEELSGFVTHLTERLSGSEDGKPKVFRDSAVGNLQEFFERFRSLNVRSNAQLDELVSRCQQVVGGIEPQQLRDNQSLRQRVVNQLSSVGSVLEGLLVDRPRRRILRTPK